MLFFDQSEQALLTDGCQSLLALGLHLLLGEGRLLLQGCPQGLRLLLLLLLVLEPLLKAASTRPTTKRARRKGIEKRARGNGPRSMTCLCKELYSQSEKSCTCPCSAGMGKE